MSLKFERKLPLILFFVFLLLTTIGFVFYQATISVQDAISWQKNTQEVLSTLDDTVTLTLDMESGMTSFMVVSNDTYLQPFYQAKPKIPQNIAKLRKLMADNPPQIEQLGQLEILLAGYTEETTRKVDIRKSQGFDVGVGELANTKGQRLIDEIRASVDWLKNEELRSLQIREQSMDNSFNRTIWILIIGSFAGLISLAIVNLLVVFEIRKRRTAEQELIAANLGLERRINERTEDLQKANENLSEIGLERETLFVNEQKARKDAEIANRLRDEFMATVSHELRTPLNSILGWARLMKGGTLDPNQLTKAVTTIIKNSETQNRLIEDMLDVARIISGKLVLEPGAVDVADVVRHSAESSKPAANAKNISINVRIDDNAKAVVAQGDKNRLIQVFSNLLTNSVKFGRENGRTDVALAVKNDKVEIRVADDGIGISSDFLPLVFERFRQDSSASAKNGGLGLGLAIVRNLVEMHGGSVSVSSEGENKGSTFTVVLPVKKTTS